MMQVPEERPWFHVPFRPHLRNFYGSFSAAVRLAAIPAGKQIINPRHTVNATGVKILAHKGRRQNSCARTQKNDAAANTVADIQRHARETAHTPGNMHE